MTVIFEERLSDSPYMETVSRGWTASEGLLSVPPRSIGIWSCAHSEATPGSWSWAHCNGRYRDLGEGAELIWVKFKLGTFMPHLPHKSFWIVRRSCLERRANPSGSRALPGNFPTTKMWRRL